MISIPTDFHIICFLEPIPYLSLASPLALSHSHPFPLQTTCELSEWHARMRRILSAHCYYLEYECLLMLHCIAARRVVLTHYYNVVLYARHYSVPRYSTRQKIKNQKKQPPPSPPPPPPLEAKAKTRGEHKNINTQKQRTSTNQHISHRTAAHPHLVHTAPLTPPLPITTPHPPPPIALSPQLPSSTLVSTLFTRPAIPSYPIPPAPLSSLYPPLPNPSPQSIHPSILPFQP